MSFLQVQGISKKEGENLILNDISFNQESFQKIAIAGATGSGKTTLLKIIVGLTQPTNGTIFFDGIKLKGPEEKLIPGHPKIAYLSQHFELRNHYRVEEILEMSNQLSTDEASLIYSICKIDHLLKRWTHGGLSGGEKQRISLAKLLVTAPQLLLLDEPFSNLDAIHKKILKTVIANISETLNITCLLVSHDPVDVLSWADEIIVLNNGEIVQKGSPKFLYHQPADQYVAALFGKYNILTPALARAFSDFADVEINQINSFVRPENFILSRENKGVKGNVNKVLFNGSFNEVEVQIGVHTITALSTNNFSPGDEVNVLLNMYR